MNSHRLELMPLAVITGADKNPKRHAEATIRESVERFGYVEPMVLDERTQRLVAGHGRLKSLRVACHAGGKPPRGIVVKDGEWHVPVIRGWASRSDAEAEAYLLASNQLTAAGGWDAPELADMLKSLAAQDALNGTGFDTAAVDAVLKEAAAEVEPKAGLTDPDDVPAVDEATVKAGELYALGKHRLLCGDSTRPDDVARVMGGAPADLVWTDPPYGVDYESKAGKVHNDDAAGLPALLKAAFSLAFQTLKPGCFLYAAHPAGDKAPAFYDALRDSGFTIKADLVWVKDRMVMGRMDYHFKHEPILYAVKPGGEGRRGRFGGTGWYGDNKQTSVFDIPRPQRSDDHPTMKPVALVEAMVRNSSAPGHVVYEPFSGSGTTLMACERLERECHAIELSPVYASRTIARWEAFTGKRAERLDEPPAPKRRGGERANDHRRARRGGR